ncbi:MAG TPA: hypothetical protein PK082_05325 [Phycisphaerae bacterium]|nr:hypothetical protein [Phycisphaerae bacterium]
MGATVKRDIVGIDRAEDTLKPTTLEGGTPLEGGTHPQKNQKKNVKIG